MKVEGAETAGDHDLHMLGVLLAARPTEGAKLLQKVLDNHHRLAINRFAKAKDEAELAALWDAAMKGGDIPGAYWAVLTHPLSTDQLTRRVFGDVHMLSHLVGATNRADIRRLRELQEQNAALMERVDATQRRLRDDVSERDRTIQRLNEQLAQKLADEKQLTARANDASNFLDVIRELERRLDEEITRRQSADANLELMSAAYEDTARACKDADRRARRAPPRDRVDRSADRRGPAAGRRAVVRCGRSVRHDRALRRGPGEADAAAAGADRAHQRQPSCITTAAWRTAPRCCPAWSAAPTSPCSRSTA